MKKIIIALMLIVCLALTGCTHILMDFGVSASNEAYLCYRIDIDPSGELLSDSAIQELYNDTIDHYKEMGFTTEVEKRDGGWTIIMEKRVPCEDELQAFDALKAMLTDEKTSPFLEVNMDALPTDHERAFRFHAKTDYAKVIESSNLHLLPEELRKRVESKLGEITGEMILTLPATSAFDGEGEMLEGQNRYQIKRAFDLSGPVAVDMTARLGLGADLSDQLSQAQQQGQLWNNLMIGAIGVAAIALAALIFSWIRLRRAKKAAPAMMPGMAHPPPWPGAQFPPPPMQPPVMPMPQDPSTANPPNQNPPTV